MSALFENLLGLIRESPPRESLFSTLPGIAHLLFRHREGAYELLEQEGYGEREIYYDFLEQPEVQAQILEEGALQISRAGFVPGYKVWVVVDRLSDPEYFAVIEASDNRQDLGVALRAVLIAYTADRFGWRGVDVGELPAWHNRILPDLTRALSPLLIVSESGSGEVRLARALIREKYGSVRRGVFFSPGRLSAAIQLREIFGDSPGRRLGGRGPGVSILQRPEEIVVIQEVADLASEVQLRILSLLTSSREPEKFWIFLTSRDLGAMAKAGIFDSGLYEILRPGQHILPPVRECPGDLPAEVRSIFRRLTGRYRRGIELSAAAAESIQGYDWPGNIDELEATLESAYLMCQQRVLEPGDLRLGDFDGRGSQDDELNLRSRTEELEKLLLLRAYALHAGNQVHMARALGISRGSLQYKMEKYRLQ